MVRTPFRRFFGSVRSRFPRVNENRRGAVGMWESQQRFPRAVGNERETWFWFSSLSTARHFHSAPQFSYGLAFRLKAEKQKPLGVLHLPCGFGVALRLGELVQNLNAHARLEIALTVWQS